METKHIKRFAELSSITFALEQAARVLHSHETRCLNFRLADLTLPILEKTIPRDDYLHIKNFSDRVNSPGGIFKEDEFEDFADFVDDLRVRLEERSAEKYWRSPVNACAAFIFAVDYFPQLVWSTVEWAFNYREPSDHLAVAFPHMAAAVLRPVAEVLLLDAIERHR